MRMITMNKLIQCCGVLFVVAGLMLPGSVGATTPSNCTSVEDITDQENTPLSYTFVDPSTVCYSFQVGAKPDTLKVTLKYDNHGGSIEGRPGAEVDLDIFLFDSSGSNTVVLNSDQSSNQGVNEAVQLKESGSPTLVGNTTYYVWINGVEAMDGYGFTLEWLDLDNSSNLPTITEGSENPLNGATGVQAGASGQSLEVAVSNSTSCTIYYGRDENNISASVTDNEADSCKITVPYGDDMTNSGTNYWYVEAVNSTGTTRYPTNGFLSFTMSTASDKKATIAPLLMLLLNKKEEGNGTSGGEAKSLPWLMLLL